MVKKQDYYKFLDKVLSGNITPEYALGFEKERTFFLSNINKGSTVVDVGCGNGRMTKLLAAQVGRKGRVVAFDNNEEALKKAKKECDFPNIDVFLMDAEAIAILNQLSHSAGKYDKIDCVVFSYGLLGQMDYVEVGRVLRGTKELLKYHGNEEAKVLATFFKDTAAHLQTEQYLSTGLNNIHITSTEIFLEEIQHTTVRYRKEEIIGLFKRNGFEDFINADSYSLDSVSNVVNSEQANEDKDATKKLSAIVDLCPLYYGIIAR